MARSGLKTFVRVMKQIDRASKQSARREASALREWEREQNRQEKEWEREERRQEKEWLREQREREKAIAAEKREAAIRQKQNEQDFLQAGQDAYARRCQRRAELRESILKSLFS